MNGMDFWKRVHADNRMVWLGCLTAGMPNPDGRGHGEEPPPLEEDTVYVAGPGSPTGAFSIPVMAILEETWDVLGKIILGVRPPTVLGHLTRIVGYFSKTKAWNRSKLAELRDRQKGARFLFEETGEEFKETGQKVLNGSPEKECPCER